MKPKQHDRLFGLDVLRAIAIILVFLAHYSGQFSHPHWLNEVSKFGWAGVDLFFVLSGYLIASQLFVTIANNEKIPLRIFFIKRFFRIIPPYLLVVAVYFVFAGSRERGDLAPLWKYLTFTQNLGLDISSQGTFSHAWSLCIEEQFYLVLPFSLVALVYTKTIKQGCFLLMVLFVAGLLARAYCWYNFVLPAIDEDDFWIIWYKYMYYPTYARLDGLLIGVSIAALYQFKPAVKEKLNTLSNWFIAASLLTFIVTFIVCSDEQSMLTSVVGFTLVDIGFGFLLIGIVSSNCFLYAKRSTVITKIATLSYGIYLTHKIIIHLTQTTLFKLGFDKASIWVLLICVGNCFVCAMLLNVIIEKPFLRIRDRILAAK